jgi:pimeloyl-ACP methyl ester carboxylesterase
VASDENVLASFKVGEGTRGTLLLHGFLGSGVNLRAFARRWAERAPERVFLLPDLRGHGTSPRLRPNDDLNACARDVVATAKAAGLGAPFDVVGHSLGGRVGLALARVESEVLGSLTVLDIAPGPIEASRSPTRAVLDLLRAAPDTVPDRRVMRSFFVDRGVSPALADWLCMNLVDDGHGYSWRIDRRALDALHARFTADDLWPVALDCPVPLRFIRGGQSGYMTASDVQRLNDARVPVHTLADAGHYVHVDALDDLVDMVTSPVT